MKCQNVRLGLGCSLNTVKPLYLECHLFREFGGYKENRQIKWHTNIYSQQTFCLGYYEDVFIDPFHLHLPPTLLLLLQQSAASVWVNAVFRPALLLSLLLCSRSDKKDYYTLVFYNVFSHCEVTFIFEQGNQILVYCKSNIFLFSLQGFIKNLRNYCGIVNTIQAHSL